jgi:hypothetical protein
MMDVLTSRLQALTRQIQQHLTGDLFYTRLLTGETGFLFADPKRVIDADGISIVLEGGDESSAYSGRKIDSFITEVLK